MAKVLLACEANVSNHPFARRDFERLSYYASIDQINKHTIVDKPMEADIVVFVGSSKANFSDIKCSHLYKMHKNKSVIFYSGDKGIPILPGVYTCLENNWMTRSRKSVLSGFYLRVTDNDSLDIDDDINNAKYLFSFIGNALNHPIRQNICRLSYSHSYLKDSSTDKRQQDDGISGDNKERGILYRRVMAQSKFILCPRGVGVSSWRLFETMRAGRVPVIISDSWIPPNGPKWESFALFVKESEVGQLPMILEKKRIPIKLLCRYCTKRMGEVVFKGNCLYNSN